LGRSNAHLHHTGILLQKEPAARVFSAALPTELQQLSLLAGIVGLVDVARAFATLQILAAGISSSGFLSDALPLSYSNSRHRWESNPRLSEPDVTRAFTTPQTLESFSLPPYFVASLLRLPHTLVASRCAANFPPPLSGSEISGRNQRSRAFGFRTRAFRLFRRSNRELHHPGSITFEGKSLRHSDLRRPCKLGI
jgi:hypothetical protein